MIRKKLTSSYRDPSGFVFRNNDSLYRSVSYIYKDHYDYLISSGLYEELTSKKLLIPHIEVKAREYWEYKLIKPEQVKLFSYPYEWCFSQLKEAALLTLKVQKLALKYGMILKDASSFNVTFDKGKAIFIDTLSFEKYDGRSPWKAYKQFVEHFLAPLVLASSIDQRLLSITKQYLDGIPLDLVTKIIPGSSRFNLGIFIHIYLHNRSQKRSKSSMTNNRLIFSNKTALLAIVDNLMSTINNLKLNDTHSRWSNYYDITNYFNSSLKKKEEIIRSFVGNKGNLNIVDIGANNGKFSRIFAQNNNFIVSCDNDYESIEANYRINNKSGNYNILPLVIDITNPTPGLGWKNAERISFLERMKFDYILALALIHHLTISHNLPFSYTASLFQKLGKYLIIEFVPIEDSQVESLLLNKETISSKYTENVFEKEYQKYFHIEEKKKIYGSKRILYKMKSLKYHA